MIPDWTVDRRDSAYTQFSLENYFRIRPNDAAIVPRQFHFFRGIVRIERGVQQHRVLFGDDRQSAVVK